MLSASVRCNNLAKFSMAISIKKITEHIGAEIGCDCRLDQLSESDFEDVVKAFDEHSVLVFRGQPLSDEKQISFSKRFGSLETTVNSNPAGGGTVMTVLSNVDQHNKVIPPEDKRMVFNTGNQMWHTDSSFKQVPALMSLLSGREVPSSDGETQFASMRGAYDSLTDKKKQEIDDLVCVHDFAYSRALIDPNLMTTKNKLEVPPVRQAMVRENPVNKKKNLFLGAHASYVEGLALAEGRVLIAELNQKIVETEFVYSHSWKKDDLVIWDNRTVLHRGRPWDRNQRRIMHRTTVVGELTVR